MLEISDRCLVFNGQYAKLILPIKKKIIKINNYNSTLWNYLIIKYNIDVKSTLITLDGHFPSFYGNFFNFIFCSK